jgi:putative RNA 2'-phosphotransferase
MADRASRWLTWALRHAPDEAGVRLDAGGWADVDEVLAAMRRAGHRLDRAGLARLVAADAKGRYALDGDRIRANQGHSVPVDLGLEAAVPPPVLWHGTVARALPAIRAGGLRPMGRHHVHLSPDPGTARAVGARRGRPVVLRVDAAAMAAAGHRFWRSANGVWLAEAVPAAFLTEEGGAPARA